MSQYSTLVNCSTRGAGSPCDTMQEVLSKVQYYLEHYPDFQEITITNRKPSKPKKEKERKEEEVLTLSGE